jgi:hypothetical protein
MKTILLSLTLVALYSCGEITPTKDLSKDSSQDVLKSSVLPTKDTIRQRGADSAKSKYSTKSDVIGTWRHVGDDSMTFDIQKDGILYPDFTETNKYEIIKDSIKIDYNGYKEICKVELKGNDTLVLSGHDTTVYYRIKD